MLVNSSAASASAALPAEFSPAPPPGETIRHILLGSPGGIRQTVHLLHNLRYVEISQWSPTLDVPDGRLVITPESGSVISMLVKRL